MRVCDFTGAPATDKISFDADGTAYDICESVREQIYEFLASLRGQAEPPKIRNRIDEMPLSSDFGYVASGPKLKGRRKNSDS